MLGVDQPFGRRLCGDGFRNTERIPLYAAKYWLIGEAVTTGEEDAAAFLMTRYLQRVRKVIATREQGILCMNRVASVRCGSGWAARRKTHQ